MQKDLEPLYVLFNNRANELFQLLFREFSHAVAKLNRKEKEQEFRDKVETYTLYLRQRLEDIANDILNSNRHIDGFGTLSQNLRYFISEYLHNFNRKIAAL